MVHAGIKIQNCPEYTSVLPDVTTNTLKHHTPLTYNRKELQKMLTFVRAFRGEIDGIIGKETLK